MKSESEYQSMSAEWRRGNVPFSLAEISTGSEPLKVVHHHHRFTLQSDFTQLHWHHSPLQKKETSLVFLGGNSVGHWAPKHKDAFWVRHSWDAWCVSWRSIPNPSSRTHHLLLFHSSTCILLCVLNFHLLCGQKLWMKTDVAKYVLKASVGHYLLTCFFFPLILTQCQIDIAVIASDLWLWCASC